MRRPVAALTIAVLLMLALLVTPDALAHGTLDQSQMGTPNFSCGFILFLPNQICAQTFTAGITGTLDAATVVVSASGNALSGWLQIYATSGGVPTGAPLASTPFTVPPFPTAVTVTFSPGVPVVAGQMYALGMAPSGLSLFQSISWEAVEGPPDPYPRGQETVSYNGSAGPWLQYSNVDLDFQTFVTPPSQSYTVHPSYAPAPSGPPPYSGQGFDPRCVYGCPPNGLP